MDRPRGNLWIRISGSLNPAMVALLLHPLYSGAAHRMARYNVVWNSPSENVSGQMPIGNGDIAANVCVIEDDALYLLLAKNDAFNYAGDTFKTGRVRVALTPNPFSKEKPFKQTLDLPTGSIQIEADGVKLRIWADANRAVYHVQVDSPEDITVSATPEFWKRFNTCTGNLTSFWAQNPTQDVRVDRDNHILWYFAVQGRTDTSGLVTKQFPEAFYDPYQSNTFGNLLESSELGLKNGDLVGSGRRFDIRIHALCEQEPDIDRWIQKLERQAGQALQVERDWTAHCEWWRQFWDRSWIVVSDNTLPEAERELLSGEGYVRRRPDKDGGALVAQSYNVFRYMMACQSRGKVQVKSNGGLFTHPLLYGSYKESGQYMRATEQPDGTWRGHEDERVNGRRFTFQSQRLLYWPLLMSGDFDLLDPFYRYYRALLPSRKAMTQWSFGHEGAYFRENISPAGTESDCGWIRKPPNVPPGENTGQGNHYSFHFTSGLELLTMMLEYVKFTGDERFRDEVMVPLAREVLLFFDKHYSRDSQGRVRIDPGQVLESWWIAFNPAPDVAGLTYCLEELLGMKAGAPEDLERWARFRSEIPPIPLHSIRGGQAIAPAVEWAKKRNVENGELYPVFPFHCFGLGLGNIEIVQWTMLHRSNRDAFDCGSWTQDQIHWAYAGNAIEAQKGLVTRFRAASDQCRFPLYGRRITNECPDLDHFGAGSTALQRMLVQEAKGKIHLLPAWPATWDAEFKLHLEHKTVISGRVTGGRLTEWRVTPQSRQSDVILHDPQHEPDPDTTRDEYWADIPTNMHPLRVGSDQFGADRFQGKIARASILSGALTREQVRELAKRDRTTRLAEAHASVLSPEVGSTLPFDLAALGPTVSIEAWIKPDLWESGHIFDTVTPGQRDGVLVDCHRGQTIRLIVAHTEKIFRNAFRPEEWQHLMITVGKDSLAAYVNGEPLSE